MVLSAFCLGGGVGEEAFLQTQGPRSRVCESFLRQFQTACLSWDFLWLFTFSLSENQLPSCNKPHLLPLSIIETPLGWWHYPKEGHHTVGRHKLGPFHICIRNTAVTEICIKSVSIRAISVWWWWFWRRRGRLWSTTLQNYVFPLPPPVCATDAISTGPQLSCIWKCHWAWYVRFTSLCRSKTLSGIECMCAAKPAPPSSPWPPLFADVCLGEAIAHVENSSYRSIHRI